jgi:hypothetical protein
MPLDQFKIHDDGINKVLAFCDDYRMISLCISDNIDNSIRQSVRYDKLNRFASELYKLMTDEDVIHFANELLAFAENKQQKDLR